MARRRIKSDPQDFENEVPQKSSIGKLKTIRSRPLANYEETDLAPNAIQHSKYLNIKTVPQLFEALRDPNNKDLEIEAHVMFVEKGSGVATLKRMDKKTFVETYKVNAKRKTFRESIDSFAMDLDFPSNSVGQDYIPLLGGPFNKQLYLYDYLKQHATAFQTYNHDPIAHAAIHIIRDFVIGRGWRVDCKDPAAQALWDAFVEVNDVKTLVDQMCMELSLYGEQMLWWLPNNASKIEWQLRPGQESAKAVIPRVRLIDPSVIWEIITYPEDISRKIAYVWCAPTQYQMYTGKDKEQPVPGTKFIFQQIPADQVDHFKVNSVSNEKRGRSDLFPVLGYLKRLRDSVNYSIIGLQKATAWSIDTSIDGNQADIDGYIKSQESLGTIPPPGSEFVHSKKVERKYMANEGARGQNSNAFDWALSMVCAGLGIPVHYFGTHLAGSTTRASSVVATEPVTKKFEARRLVIENALHTMAKRLFKTFDIEAEIEVSFPELITQDRSAKMKDLAMAVSMGWISNERAAQIAAKELDISTFEWEVEQKTIAAEKGTDEMPALAPPLTTPGAINPLLNKGPAGAYANDKSSADYGKPKGTMTSQDQRNIRTQNVK